MSARRCASARDGRRIAWRAETSARSASVLTGAPTTGASSCGTQMLARRPLLRDDAPAR
jgi:hypothetical protein